MKVLIIHHLEPCWSSGYDNKGTSFEELLDEFNSHLDDHKYDHVILTRFEEPRLEYEIYGDFKHRINSNYVYGYAWDLYCIDPEPEKLEDLIEFEPKADLWLDHSGNLWTNGGHHSEIVSVPEWMIDLRGCDVFISGAFDGECIEDLEIALDSLDIGYTRLENLIV